MCNAIITEYKDMGRQFLRKSMMQLDKSTSILSTAEFDQDFVIPHSFLRIYDWSFKLDELDIFVSYETYLQIMDEATELIGNYILT